MTIRVLIVDDQALVRAGFRMMIDAQPDMEVVGEANDGVEAVELARRLLPQVVLMDVRMPNMDGLEATRWILSQAVQPLRVVILTTYGLDEYVFDALAAGASGFLLKDVPPEDLVRAVRVTANGDALLAPSVTRQLVEAFAKRPVVSRESSRMLATLTDREREVLRLIARGRSNAEIAATLFLGESTIKTHVGHVLDKLGARDRVQAVIFAYEVGLVQPGQADSE